MENIKIDGYKNLPLNVYLYNNVKKPKASILVIHGMQEHGARYNDFATFLESKGYVVLVSDLRGHGITARSADELGRGESDDIFNEIIEDQKILADYLKKNNKAPLYVFGHSFGSFITQRFIQVYPSVDKAIICGTTNGDSAIINLGKTLASALVKFGKKDNRANLVQDMSLKSYGKGFEDGNWLTRDSEVWEEYKRDSLCGNAFPLSFFHSMLSNLSHLNKHVDAVDKNKPILFICGEKDPVGGNAKHVKSLYDFYIKKGLNAHIKIYPECRHELLNEINKSEVYNDILNFYNNEHNNNLRM